MATKEHYEFFKFLYDEELGCYAALGARAQLYISVIGFFVGAVVFKASDLERRCQGTKAAIVVAINRGESFYCRAFAGGAGNVDSQLPNSQ